MKLISGDRIELVLISNYTQDKKPSADILSTMTNTNSVGSYFGGEIQEPPRQANGGPRHSEKTCVLVFVHLDGKCLITSLRSSREFMGTNYPQFLRELRKVKNKLKDTPVSSFWSLCAKEEWTARASRKKLRELGVGQSLIVRYTKRLKILSLYIISHPYFYREFKKHTH